MENKYVEVEMDEIDRDHQHCESQESGDNLAKLFKLGLNRSLNNVIHILKMLLIIFYVNKLFSIQPK